MFRHFGVLNFLVSLEAVPKFKEHNAGELFLCIYFPLFSLWWISLMSQFCAPHGLLGYILLGVHLGWRANIETAISPGLVFPFSLFFFSGLPSPVVLVLLPSFYFNLIAENGRWMLLLNFSVSVAVDMAICFSIEFFWLLFNNWVDACQCLELLVTSFLSNCGILLVSVVVDTSHVPDLSCNSFIQQLSHLQSWNMGTWRLVWQVMWLTGWMVVRLSLLLIIVYCCYIFVSHFCNGIYIFVSDFCNGVYVCCWTQRLKKIYCLWVCWIAIG